MGPATRYTFLCNTGTVSMIKIWFELLVIISEFNSLCENVAKNMLWRDDLIPPSFLKRCVETSWHA